MGGVPDFGLRIADCELGIANRMPVYRTDERGATVPLECACHY